MEDTACLNCPAHQTSKLTRLGVDAKKYDYVVALAGNPNTGKSTVFNDLTGLKQHTGNWPGKTVSRAEGAYRFGDKRYKIVDLPGTYSLLSNSTDEEIARDFILFGEPDITVIVADATRIARNLNLVLQILEITDKAILCLNLMDEAKRYNVEIDIRTLSKELGIPVIPTSARYRHGLDRLLSVIEEVIKGHYVCHPRRIKIQNPKLKNAVESTVRSLKVEFPHLPNLNWLALRLLEGDQTVINAIKDGTLKNLDTKQLAL